MRVTETSLPGVLEIEPQLFRDDRGFLLETYNEHRFRDYRLPTTFRQDNHSRSHCGVLRGLHYQLRKPQGKLVTVIRGAIFDVAADIRRGSPTFGHWHGVVITDSEPRHLWVPPGFAHGFLVMSDVADVVYKCTELYNPSEERGVLWNDPLLAIKWPAPHPVLSPKDEQHPLLSLDTTDLPDYEP
jgi:dTDP-4-dehydrorhamnose 3,5-epimerase